MPFPPLAILGFCFLKIYYDVFLCSFLCFYVLDFVSYLSLYTDVSLGLYFFKYAVFPISSLPGLWDPDFTVVIFTVSLIFFFLFLSLFVWVWTSMCVCNLFFPASIWLFSNILILFSAMSNLLLSRKFSRQEYWSR